MIELGDTVTDTENGQKLVVGETVTLEAVERLPKRFVGEAKAEAAEKEAAEAALKAERKVKEEAALKAERKVKEEAKAAEDKKKAEAKK